MNDVKPDIDDNPAKARHYGFLFNCYVMLQIFNEVNARKLLASEWNPFSNFFSNKFFLIILIISVLVQIALVEIPVFAGALKIKPLSMVENLVSVGVGASCIIWGKFSNF
jgi:magnesium-transporting ATPase (P-type)